MTAGKRSPMKKKEICMIVLFGLIFCAAAFVYTRCILTAKCTVPYSDASMWTLTFQKMYESGRIDLKDCLGSDTGEHLHGIALLIDYFLLKGSNFNYARPVEIGIAVHLILALFVVCIFFVNAHRREQKPLGFFMLAAAVTILLCILNLNHWEMTELIFSTGTGIRLLLFFLSFLLTDRLIDRAKERGNGKNLLLCILLGTFFVLVILVFCSGYFPGYVGAMGAAGLIAFFRSADRKKLLLPLIVMAFFLLAGSLAYVLVFLLGGHQAMASGAPAVLDAVKGIVLFWGASVYHQNSHLPHGLELQYVIGGLLLLAMVVSLILYLKGRRRSLIPVMCVLYANIVAITIAFARIPVFSVTVMLSSRYTVESALGLVGLLWMLYDLNTDGCKRPFFRAASIRAVVCVLLAVLYADAVELKRAPYVKEYFENVTAVQLDYRNRSDEELNSISADGWGVSRQCLAFLDEYDLSIFAAGEE